MSAPRAVRFWDVKVTPKKNRVIGTLLVRAVGGKLSYRSRRLTIEIHNADSGALEDLKESAYVGSKKSSLLRRGTSSFRSTGDEPLLDRAGGLQQNDKIMIRVLRRLRRKVVESQDLSILKSVRETMHFGNETDSLIDFLTDDEKMEVADDTEEGGWLEHRRYVLDAVAILKHSKNSVTVKLGQGGQQELRQVIFPSEDDAALFCNEIELLELAFNERAEKRIRKERELPASESGHRDIFSLRRLPLENKGISRHCSAGYISWRV
jgi:hypothetical protein